LQCKEQLTLLVQLWSNPWYPLDVLSEMDLLELSMNKLSKRLVGLLWPPFMKVLDGGNTLV
jgi:hypothetical protein